MIRRALYWKRAGIFALTAILTGVGIRQAFQTNPSSVYSRGLTSRYIPAMFRQEAQSTESTGLSEDGTKAFSGRISLLGTEHSGPGESIRLSLHVYSTTPNVRMDRMETEIWFDRRRFAFDHATGLSEPVRSEPGRVRVAVKTDHSFPEPGQGEYRKSRVAELYFRPVSKEGGIGSFVLEGTRFLYQGAAIPISRLGTDHAQVRIHPRQEEDRNGDGLVSIGDLAIGADGTEQEAQMVGKLGIYPYKRVVVIGIDGAGNAISPDAPYYRMLTSRPVRMADHFRLPHLRAILKRGAVSYTASSTEPTSSSPNWGAMLTGVDYKKHGISNSLSGETYYSGAYPTVFSRLREMAPERRLAFFAHWSHLLDGHIEPAAGVAKFAGDDGQLVKDFVRYVDSGQAVDTSLLFLVLDEVDNAGHNRGWFTRSYYRALEKADHKVGEIYEALRRNGLLDDTLVLVVADHGGGTAAVGRAAYRSRSHSHGGRLAKTVFFGASGRTVSSSYDDHERLLSGGHTRDVAATILNALGDERGIGDSTPLPGMFLPKEEGQTGEVRIPSSYAEPQADHSAGTIWLSKHDQGTHGSPEYELSLSDTGSRSKAAIVRLAFEPGKGWKGQEAPSLHAIPLVPGIRAYLAPEAKWGAESRLVIIASGLLPMKTPLVRLVGSPNAPAGSGFPALRPLQAAIADFNGCETLPAVKLVETGTEAVR
ncbi:alkaline phosphatase family protein [Gorillibacterium timonense]|uniref:alkaline phosphatase family protein n=1 Tax=Gorillibacterium timonense TaxID=1689269 RepID=UPI00131E7121|nr:alkaline phosphatase [Gorillibacterium timonense]